MKTLLAALILAAAPARAHKNIAFTAVAPAAVQYTVSTEDNPGGQSGTIPGSGRVDSTVLGYINHDGNEEVRMTYDDGLGAVVCAPQVVGLYEPAFHYGVTCTPTFTYDGGARTCATTCPVRPLTPPSPGSLPKAFPNPLRVGVNGDAMKFMNLPANAPVRIYGASGRLVYMANSGAGGDLHWHLRDTSGAPAGSGVYRAVAQGTDGLKTVLFAIQR